jgi:uncharacterized protein (DUF2062 family)
MPLDHPPADFRPVAVAPTFNNAGTLADVLRRVRGQGLHAIVVDDGCTDETADVLSREPAADVTVVTHGRNRGKAAALLTGFATALAAGYTHAVTIDTDGQLDPEEIPALLDEARRRPLALVVGRRDGTIPGYPTKSRVGRRVSNLLVRLESGVRVDDSQCGFRVYPLGLVAAVPCRVGHYGFETEIITRAGWARCEVAQVSVACRYMPADQRVSHFKPWRDSLRGARMHLFLLGRAFTPWPRHPRWPAAPAAAAIADDGVEPGRPRPAAWRRLCNWLSPARAWRQLRAGEVARSEIAAGLAVGVFIANLPVYGLQSVLSLYTARRFHLHPLSVLLGSHVSTPPVGPLMIFAAIALGHFLFHGTLPAVADFDPRRHPWSEILGPRLLEWLIGGVVLGFVMAVGTFVLFNYLMRVFDPRGRDVVRN